MAKRPITRDEFFLDPNNRETIALALYLYKQIRQDIGGLSWADSALEYADMCRVLGVEAESSKVLRELPRITIMVEDDPT